MRQHETWYKTVINPTGKLPVNRLLSFVLALTSGLITWGFIHTQDPFFKVEEQYHIRGLGESDERWSAYLEQQSRVDFMNAALVIGILGGTLAVALAVSRPTRVSILKLLMGIVLGILVGVVAGIAGCWMQQYLTGLGQLSVVESAYINATLFGVLGLGLGAIIGSWSGAGRAIVERALVGLIAGVFAGIVYPVIAFAVLASANIEAFIPQMTITRLLWLGIGTGFLGLFLPSSVGESNPKTVETAETVETAKASALSPG